MPYHLKIAHAHGKAKCREGREGILTVSITHNPFYSQIFESQQRQNNKRLNWERIVYCLLTAMPQEAPRGAY